MEISPIIVSMKTASVSIVITFFLGLAAAYGVERIRSRKLQLVCDGILTLPLGPCRLRWQDFSCCTSLG